MKHPGVFLQEKLNKSNMSRKELAIRTGVTEKHISTIINGERKISAAFARKLGYVFECPEYWLERQNQFDEEQLRIQEENSISAEEFDILRHLREIINYLIQCGFIHNDCGDSSKVMQLRQFLKISDLTQIPKITYNAAYRAQLSSNIQVDPYVLFAWQRLCEVETENIHVNKEIDKKMLADSVCKMKNLMHGDINHGIEELQHIFAKCGIAFQVVRNFRGAPVQGFIKLTAENRLVLCVTIRGKRADRFWFTLFHEIGHVLNDDYLKRFVDFDSVQGKAESEADKFARNTLLDPAKYREFILSDDITSWNRIEVFAHENDVEPFIVLGRLQNDGYLDWSDYSDKVVHYKWA